MTNLFEIPKGWEWVNFGSVAEVSGNLVDPARYLRSPHVAPNNIESETGRLLSWRTIAEDGVSSPKHTFEAGQILYSKIRPNLAKVVIPEFSGLCSADMYPIATSMYSRYLLRWMLHPKFTRAATRYEGRNVLPKINKTALATLPVPLPPLSEQKRIAEVLDQVDALRAKRREAIALLDDLAQSIFLDMFGDPAEGWPHVSVGDLAVVGKNGIRTGPFGSQLLTEEFTDEGVSVLGIDNAVRNEFAWSERRFISEVKYRQLTRYTVNPGDLLITIMGTCGRCAVVPEDIPLAINTKHLCCITLAKEKCLPGFLHSYFLVHPVSRRYLAQTAKGAIMAGLNMGIIKALPVRLPPLELQQQYVGRVEKVRQVRKQHEMHLAALDEVFESLQQRAFSGRLWDHEAA